MTTYLLDQIGQHGSVVSILTGIHDHGKDLEDAMARPLCMPPALHTKHWLRRTLS